MTLPPRPGLSVVARHTAVTLLLMAMACGGGSRGPAQPAASSVQQIDNLHAFARLYGVVRWFHPSDSAAVVDWDQFAVEGVRRVMSAPDRQALRSVLGELISSFAPTVRIAASGEAFPEEPKPTSANAAGLDVVAWEHLGYGDSAIAGVYASKRRHRDRIAAVPGAPFAALSQAVDAAPLRGAKIRLRGKLRSERHGRARLWLRVERDNTNVFFDNMAERPVMAATWQEAEITTTVDAEATRLVFGPLLSGAGTAWYDDLELAAQGVDGAWKPLEVQGSGFESDELSAAWKRGTGRSAVATTDGWNITLDPTNPASGQASLRIEAATKVVTEELFPDAPKPGETVDIELGSGLRARVPIALYSKNGHTVGDAPAATLQSRPLSNVEPASFDVVLGVADVIVAWNVLQHFWPYWDTVSVDWIAELDIALRDALDDRSMIDHVATLRRLSVAAPDGHASTVCPGDAPLAQPPIAVEVVEGQIVVTASADPAVVRGDVVVAVDGKPAVAYLTASQELISGSPQWRLTSASHQFGAGPAGSTLALRIRRGGSDLSVHVERSDKKVEEPSRPSVERLGDGVYYVNFGHATTRDVDGAMDSLASAPGVVFDLRNYPRGEPPILSHLLTRPDDAKTWGAVARVIRPDHSPKSVSSWDTSGWELPVEQPHISGRVAFLIGPNAISYAESLLGFVEYYHLGEIVGSPTAGTNGDVAEIAEPSGCHTVFTGARMTRLDGSRLHLVGIRPTIPATRTIAGVVAGRDEVLERALLYIRGGSK